MIRVICVQPKRISIADSAQIEWEPTIESRISAARMNGRPKKMSVSREISTSTHPPK